MERYIGLFRAEKVGDRGSDMADLLRYGGRLLRYGAERVEDRGLDMADLLRYRERLWYVVGRTHSGGWRLAIMRLAVMRNEVGGNEVMRLAVNEE
eukprot:scaffold44_cov152-Amphora_coffeaeformis.AAC.2